MKTNYVKQIIVLILFAGFSASAQNTASNAILIKGNKFTYPLIERWIAEYRKENPSVQFLLVNKSADAQQADISVVAHEIEKTALTESQQIVYVNKFALLPVASTANSYVKNLKERSLDKRGLEKLYFEASILDEKKDKVKSPLTVYARESQACSAISFAKYFGHESSDIKGKKISGDDVFLLSAIKKDTLGITFNNLAYIYDQQSRKIKDGLRILPLDVDKEASAALNTSVDDAIAALEKDEYETIPVGKIGFVLNNGTNNKELIQFLSWVLNSGQQFNHQFGFLNLEQTLLKKQSDKLSETLLTAK